MIDLAKFFAFLAVAVVIVPIPGPSVLFVIGRAFALGRRAALVTVAGNAAGLFAQVMLLAVGLGAVVERSVLVFNMLKVAGGLYLVYLGIQAFRHRSELRPAAGTSEKLVDSRHVFRQGGVVGLTNPKTIVFFSAILPQFVEPSLGHVPLQLLILGAVFVGIALLCDSIWAMAAGTARVWFERSPGRLPVIGGVGGVVMMGLGLRLLMTGQKQ